MAEDVSMRVKTKRQLTSAPPYEVGEWAVFAPFTATFTHLETEGIEGVESVVMDVDTIGGQLQPVRIEVTSNNGEAISGTTIRSIPVQRLMRAAIPYQMVNRDDDGAYSSPWRFDAEAVRAAGPTDESLRAVASVYLLAKFIGEPPARTVELMLDMPRTTASQWVRKAKERGILRALESRPGKSL